MRNIIILGASGSIGEQTQEILLDNNKEFNLVGLSIGNQIHKLDDIINKFQSVKVVCLKNYQDYLVYKNKYPSITFFYGDEGLISLIDACEADIVVNALVGFVGFLPSLHTVEKGITLALANKESLVVGGELIKQTIKKTNAKLYPIDSEHVALMKCLNHKDRDTVKNLVLTASGGSFRDYSLEQLKSVTVEDALKHPSWSMGSKITIDSATMMNKGFEVIEAMHLFDYSVDNIKVLMHDESIIHSLVEFIDHSYLCDIGPTNMKVAISYALFEGNYKELNVEPLDFTKLSGLHFRELDLAKYPCLDLAYQAIKKQGTACCVLNRSNEEAVYSFLNKEISYLDIGKVVKEVLEAHQVIDNPSKEDIINADNWAKTKSKEIIRRLKTWAY
jgi:1-deoxy-D-xylulose-5-phosphate reductoisomerase